MKRFLTAWLLVVSTFFPSLTFSALPPTRSGGQSDTLSTTFDFRAPFSQVTKYSGTGGLIETGNTNLMPNPGLEAAALLTGWSASFPAPNIVAATGGNIFFGKSATWDSAAAAERMNTPSATFPNLVGSNCEGSVFILNASGGTHTIRAYDTTNSIYLTGVQPILQGTGFLKNTVNFPCPASGTTVQIWIESVAANEPLIATDEGYLGLARNVGSTQLISEWQSFTPTGSWVTNTTYTGKWRQVGDTYEYQVYLALSGAPTATALTINHLANGFTQDTAKLLNTSTDGRQTMAECIVRSAGSVFDSTGYYNGSNIAPIVKAAGGTYATSSTNVNATVPATFANGDSVLCKGAVPIVGWTAQTLVMPNAQGLSWSGTHANDCAWSTTSASLAAIGTGDASCTFATLSNRNFGTVTSAKASGNNIPGIVFTPVLSGKYFVCATTHAYNASAVGNFVGLAIHDGTSIISSASRRNGAASSGTNDEIPITMCGMATLSAGASRTVQVYASASAGTTTIATGASGVALVTWNIFNIDQPVSAILANSVSTDNTNGAKISWAKVAPSCNTATCTIQDASSDVVSVTRSSTGIYSVNFKAGFWSVAPTCTYQCGNGSNLFFGDGAGAAASTSVMPIQCYTSAAVLSDAGLRVQCSSPR